MKINVPLTPHLEQFVRQLLVNGSFENEGDVVRAALRLLENQSSAGSSLGPRRKRSDPGLTKQPQPASEGFRNEMREPLRGDHTAGNPSSKDAGSRRSPRGILADMPSHISPDDIKQARNELWANFPHGEA